MQDALIAQHRADAQQARDRRCPLCDCRVHRVQRRLLDILKSWLQPVRRYRCRSGVCAWEGNLRITRDTSTGDGGAERYSGRRQRLL